MKGTKDVLLVKHFQVPDCRQQSQCLPGSLALWLSGSLALWLVVDFSISDQGEAAAMMVAAMLCNVMLILKLEGLRRELR